MKIKDIEKDRSLVFILCNCYSSFSSLKEVDFPIHLLPAVVDAPHLAGSLAADWHGIPQGTPIGVAMGDLQCSIFAAQPTITDAGIGKLVLLVVPIYRHR